MSASRRPHRQPVEWFERLVVTIRDRLRLPASQPETQRNPQKGGGLCLAAAWRQLVASLL